MYDDKSIFWPSWFTSFQNPTCKIMNLYQNTQTLHNVPAITKKTSLKQLIFNDKHNQILL